MRWTRAASARRRWSQGGIARERCHVRARRTTAQRTAKPCGPDTRCWCQARGGFVGPTGSGKTFNPLATVTRRIRGRGERGISRKTIAQGMPDCSVCTCFSRVRSTLLFAHEAAVKNAPGIACTLLFGVRPMQNPDQRAAGTRNDAFPASQAEAGEGLRSRGRRSSADSRNAGTRLTGPEASCSLREIVKRRLAKIAIPPLSLLPAMPHICAKPLK